MPVKSDFIRYVGPPTIHDSTFLLFQKAESDSFDVHLKSADGDIIILRFIDVSDITYSKPEGMFVYALSEVTCDLGLHRYIFVNSEEDSESFFEITCKEIQIQT
jgi:hypothetical protein